jgi:thiol-disulfide isomerase/thioredoxin
MTPTIIFWLRIGIMLLLAYTIYSHFRQSRKRGYWIPRQRADWKPILNDVFTLFAGGFAWWMLETNYQAPMDSVMKQGKSDISQLSYLDLQSGKTQKISDLHGKVVVLNIWATWCPPCRRELPDLNEVQQTIGQEKMVVLALSDEEAGTISSYLRDKGFTFTSGVFTTMPESIQKVGTRPVSILIDQNGEIREMVVGARGASFFKEWVTTLLK